MNESPTVRQSLQEIKRAFGRRLGGVWPRTNLSDGDVLTVKLPVHVPHTDVNDFDQFKLETVRDVTYRITAEAVGHELFLIRCTFKGHGYVLQEVEGAPGTNELPSVHLWPDDSHNFPPFHALDIREAYMLALEELPTPQTPEPTNERAFDGPALLAFSEPVTATTMMAIHELVQERLRELSGTGIRAPRGY